MEDIEDLLPLLKFPDETAGGRMTTDYIALLKDMPISQALEKLRGKSQQVDVLYFYVIDEDHRLLGIVPVRSLLFADLETKVGDIVVPGVRLDLIYQNFNLIK